MGDLVPYRSPKARDEWTALVGMVIFLGSWAMMFASLFFAYGIVRAHSMVWPPPDLPTVPLALPAINTATIAASSFSLQRALRLFRTGKVEQARWGLVGAAVLGVVFLALQMVVWLKLHDEGLVMASGGYASVFYALTWFHAAHVAVGIVALGWLSFRAFAKEYTPARHLSVRLWTIYWHFVGIVWGIMFVVLYVV